jgi:mono/diheme cytochrome c family protein
MFKRLLIILGGLVILLAGGMLITFEVIKIDWVSGMEIQASYKPQEEPLLLPPNSVPIQGASYVPGLGAPVNPVPADEISLARGQQLYEINCALCHGLDGKSPTVIAVTLQNKPANLLQGNPLTNSDGANFIVITNGVAGKMPALRENLPNPRERWDVVNYLRALQEKAQP